MQDTQSYTESLLDIVEGVNLTTIMLPEFQRDFRWEMDQTYDLFDSLIKDIFIGTIIYGKPLFDMTLREIDKRPRKGKGSNIRLKTIDYTAERMQNLAQTQNLRIVLDGQQRMTSIYRALTGIDNVYIILRKDVDLTEAHKQTLESLIEDIAGEESSESISVKLSDAFDADKEGWDGEDLNAIFAKTSFAKSRTQSFTEDQKKEAEKAYRQLIKKLIAFFRKDKLVAYYQLDMSLEKFCTFFERSNSRGIQLNFTDILAAKLYRGFNLRKRIEEFESLHKLKLNREVIIRAIAYLSCAEKGRSIAIDKKYILENLDADDFDRHWDEMCKLFADTIGYLQKHHFVMAESWMPSENMLIPIMLFLRQAKGFERISEAQRCFLEFWYWSSIFANKYSTSSNEVIITDSNALIQVAKEDKITKTGYFMHLRSVITEQDDLYSYSKKTSGVYRGILNLVGYASKGLIGWNNNQAVDFTMQLEDHHIYPRGYISSNVKLDLNKEEAEQLVDCVINRTLIPKITNITIGKKAPQIYMAELKAKNEIFENSLQGHLIPLEMYREEILDERFTDLRVVP